MQIARLFIALVWSCLLLSYPLQALACPFCSSNTGAAVRAGIAADFGWNAIAVLIPFLVLTAIIWLIHFGLSFGESPVRVSALQGVEDEQNG